MPNKNTIKNIFFYVMVLVAFGVFIQTYKYLMTEFDNQTYELRKSIDERANKKRYDLLIILSQKLDRSLEEIQIEKTRIHYMKNKFRIFTKKGEDHIDKAFIHFKNILSVQKLKFNNLAEEYNDAIKLLDKENNKIIIPEGCIDILIDEYIMFNNRIVKIK